MSIRLLPALLGLLVCLPAVAQEGGKPAGKAEDPDKALAKRLESQQITVNFTDTPLSEVGAFIADMTGLSVVLGPGVDPETPVTLKLADVSLKNALKLLGAAVDGVQPRPWCGVVWLGKKGQRLPAPPAIPEDGPLARTATLNFDGTPLSEVIAFLSDMSGLKVSLSQEASAKLADATVTLRVKALPVVRVLALLQAMHGLSAKIEGESVLLEPAAESPGGEPPAKGR